MRLTLLDVGSLLRLAEECADLVLVSVVELADVEVIDLGRGHRFGFVGSGRLLGLFFG